MNRSMLDRALERQRASNQPIDATPMKLIELLVTTNKGWIVRQLMKGVATAGTAATTWLVAHGVSLDNPQAITAALTTIAVGLAEVGFSKVASKIEAK